MKEKYATIGKILWGVFGLTIFGLAAQVYALVSYPPAALLQPGDITGTMIRNQAITDTNVSNTAAISATKIVPRGAQGTVLLSDGTNFATTTALTFATSSPTLSVIGGKISATSTSFNGLDYTWPSSRGAANTALTEDGSGNLSFKTNAPTTLQVTATTSETITVNQLVQMATSTVYATTTPMGANTNVVCQNIGDVYQRQIIAGAFNASSPYMPTVTFNLKNTGSPTDKIMIQVENNVAGHPGNGSIASTTVSAALLTSTQTAYSFTIPPAAAATIGNEYWFTFTRTGALDASNYAQICFNNNSTYNPPGEKQWDGTSWGGSGVWALIGSYTQSWQFPGQIHRASGAAYDYSGGILGFLKDTSDATGTAATFYVAGTVSVGGLSPGTCYYAGNASSTLSTTAGTYGQKVGCSPDGVNLIIEKNW